MFTALKHRGTLVAVTALLTASGGAITAASASAQTFFPTSMSMTPVPAGVALTTNSTSSLISFTNSDGSSTYAFCTTSSLNGKTTLNGAGTGSKSNGFSITSASFGPCRSAGASITVTPILPWQVTLTSCGGSATCSATVSHVGLVFTCGSMSATYAGNLTSGVTWQDGSPSSIKFVNAASLSRTMGTGCVSIPGTIYLNGTWTLSTVGGSTASAANNLWAKF